MRKLALHQITMMEGGPEGLVRFAAEAGLDEVCLFTATPVDKQGQDMFPVVTPSASASFKRLLHDHDMRIINAAGCNSLDKAATLHGHVNQPNLGIAIDALHLFRTGGTLEQLETMDPAIITYVQLCDGPDFHLSGDYLDEAMNRMIPGEGVFPLKNLAALLGPHVDIDIEVPDFAGCGGSDAKSWAHRAVTASRNLLD